MTSPHRKQNIQFKKLKLVNIVKMFKYNRTMINSLAF